MEWIDRNWKARIVSLFRMESAPAIVPKANPVPQRSTSPTPPWEAMQQACARQETKPDWIHAPSLMQKENTLRRYNSLQLDSLLRRRDGRRFIDHTPHRTDL